MPVEVHREAASSDAASFFVPRTPSALAALVLGAPALIAITLSHPFPAGLHTYHPTFAKQFIFQSAVLAACWLGIVSWGGALARSATASLRQRRPAALLLALVALAGASACWSRAPGVSLCAASLLLFWAAWAIVVAHYAATSERTQAVAWSIIAAAGLAGALGLGLYRWPLAGDPSPANVLMLPMGNPNFMAGLLNAGIMLAAARCVSSRARLRVRVSTCLLLVLMAVALRLTRSDAGLVALAAGACTLAWLRAPRAIKAAGLIIAVLGCVLAAGFMAAPHGRVAGRVMAVAMDPDSTFHARPFDWMAAVDMIRERPLLGRGEGGFLLAHPTFRPASANLYQWASDRAFDIHPHNEWLDVAVETGLLGLLLYVALLVSLTFTACRGLAAAPPERRWALIGGIAALVSLQVHGMVGVGLRYWDLAPFQWTIVGLLMSASWPVPAAPDPAPRRRPWLPACAGAACLALWVLVPVRGYRAQVRTLRGVRAAHAGAHEAAAAHLLQALGDATYYVDAVRLQFLLAREYARLPDGLGIDAALERFRKLDALAPNFMRTKFEIGRLLLKQRQYAEAAAWLRDFLRFNPYLPQARAALAAAHEGAGDAAAMRGDWPAAAAAYRDAYRARPGRALAAAKLARAAAKAGDGAAASRWLRWPRVKGSSDPQVRDLARRAAAALERCAPTSRRAD